MHPKTPKIDEKTLTIKGLILVCEDPSYIVDFGPSQDGESSPERFQPLCARCKAEVGLGFEKIGAKIRLIDKREA